MRKIYFRPEQCDGCKECEQVCIEKNSRIQSALTPSVQNLIQKPRITVEESKGRYSAITCQHCVHALCVEACMAGALQYSDEGNVIHDPEQCVGCWMCVMVCPFGAIKPQQEIKKAEKCHLCRDEEQPPCVTACTRKALLYCTSEEYEQWIEGEDACTT